MDGGRDPSSNSVGGSAAPDSAVDLRDVQVRLTGRRVLGPVSLRVRRHERWVILGPNGSGKTTLLGLIGGWRHPSVGDATVLGIRFGRGDIRALRTRIGYVSHTLAERFAPGTPVDEVVATGRSSTVATWPREVTPRERERVAAVIEEVGCAHLRRQTFGTCSQGERQRILLARALLRPTELLLLDEPAAGLDLPGREGLIAAVDAIPTTDGGLAMLMATHHLDEVPASVTHAALLRDGQLVAAGPIAEALTTETLERCFGLPLAVERRGGRWSAWSADGAVPFARP